ncbi:MAG: hypothetical protein K8963_04110 [Proteobacteria bacterium]|nr:hypothetical protein [Pseudomonadota bacterium]
MLNENICYVVYKRRDNRVKAYSIIKKSEGKKIYVLDVSKNRIKTFIQACVLEETNSFEAAEQRAKILQADHLVLKSKPVHKQTGKIEVCFTGFKADIKEELIKYAKEKGCIVRSNVTACLDVLVCGETKGWKKAEKAESQGVSSVFGRAGFEEFLATGATSE